MGPTESGPTPSATAATGGPSNTPLTRAYPSFTSRHGGVMLVVGVVTGLIAWLAGELAYGVFTPRVEPVRVALTTFMQSTEKSEREAEGKNAALAYAILGGVAGLGMGFAGGLFAQSPRRGLVAGLIGAIFGTLAGFGASRGLLPMFYRSFVPDPNDLFTPMLIHAGIWTSVGIVAGIAFAIGMGQIRTAPWIIGGAALGAVGATVLVHLISGMVLPESGYAEPIAKSTWARCLGRILVTTLIAYGVAKGAQHQDRREKPAAEAGPAMA